MKRLLVLGLALAATLAIAESITLKSGETLDGEITKVNKDGASVTRDGVRVDVPWDYLDPAQAAKVWEGKLAWDDVPGMTDLANFCEAKGLPDDARRVWEKVVKAAPDHDEARAALGYVKEGAEWVLASAKKAVEPVKPDLGEAPKDNLTPPAGTNKGAIEAVEKGKSLIEEAKKNPKRVVETGEVAVAEFRKAIKLDKNFALAWYHLGIAYQFTKDYRDAVDALSKAIQLNSKFFEAMVELGDAYAWLRNEDMAVEWYRKALDVNPSYALAFRNTALVEMKRRHFKEAREACDQALKLDAADGFLKQISPMIDAEIRGPGFGDSETRKKSKHFEVITDGGDKVADVMSENLERIYTIYEKVFPKIEKDDLVFPVIVYKDAAGYQQSGAPPGTGGYFSPYVKKLVFYWMGDGAKVQDTLMVLYHETFHAFLDYYLEDATQWFNEGHGDYFGAWKWDESRKMMVLRTNWWRLDVIKNALRQNRHTPVKDLLQMTQQEMYNPQSVSVNYAEAWSLVYFMWNYQNGKYAGLIRNYFFEMQKGSGIKRAYDNTFGKVDMKVFQEEWERYTQALERPKDAPPPKGR
jgi:tetratricopeptide (TPR) repeat protein